MFIQFFIAIPLLLAIAATEWPAPAGYLGPAPNLAVVWWGLWLHILLPAVVLWGWQIWAATYRLGSSHFVAWLSLTVWTLASLSLTWVWGWSDWVTRVTDNHGLWATTLILLPHLFGLQWVWTTPALPRLWQASHTHPPTVWYLWRQLGNDLLGRLQWYLFPVLLPLLVVVGGREVLEGTAWWAGLDWMTQVVTLTAGSMFAVWLIFPLVLGYFLPTRPLDDPVLRDWARRTSRVLRLGCREVACWETHHRVANAMVLGGLPPWRRILISDVLCQRLSRAELGAVFLHEAGHLRRHHLAWRMLTLALVAQVLLLGIRQARLMGQEPAFESLEHVVVGMLAFFVWLLAALLLLGYVSRALEFDADAFVLDQVDSLAHPSDWRPLADDLISSLNKTAVLTHMPTDRVAWLHPSIDQRISRIRHLQTSVVFRRVAQRRLRLLKALLLSGFLLALFA